MANDSKLFDYEPVNRSGGWKDGAGEATVDDWFKSPGRSGKAQIPTPTAPSTAPTKSPSPRTVGRKKKKQIFDEPLKAELLLKRGHTISYVSLFLFTVVLYFRPYELYPWLAWTSSSAFVLGVLTLASYVPTQLGLYGTLTVRTREVNLILLLSLLAILSIPQAFDPMWALKSSFEYFKVVVMFIVLMNILKTEIRMKGLIFLSILTGCILSVAAVRDYAEDKLVLGSHQRIKGLLGNLFENPNDLALFLVTMIPLAVALLLGSRGMLKKLIFGSTAVIMAAGVVATFSRSGFLGMAVASIVIAWRLSRKNQWLVLAGLPVILMGFMVLAPGGYGSRIANTSDDSAVSRTDELKRSLFITARHPLLGVGISNFIFFSNSDHASHNAYTQVSSELGIPALIVYILFIIAPLKGLKRVQRETLDQRKGVKNKFNKRFYYLAIGLEASIIGYMVSSFFASVAFVWYIYYLVAFAFCVRNLHAAVATASAPELAVKKTGAATPIAPATQPSLT